MKRHILIMLAFSALSYLSSCGNETATPEQPESFDYIDEKGINRGIGIEINGIIWAPVNCGYDEDFPYGKLYQWGRTDGQGYNGEEDNSADDPSYPTFEDNTIVGPLEYGASADADKFYTCGDYEQWMKKSGDQYAFYNITWDNIGSLIPSSGIGDPCPQGWRVPTYDEMNLLIANTYPNDGNNFHEQNGIKGFIATGLNEYHEGTSEYVFLPCAGYRSYAGYAYDRNYRAEYWCSTSNYEMGYNFLVRPGKKGAFPSPTGFAMAIRCVKK